MPIPLIVGAKIGIKKACAFVAGRAATAGATAARVPRPAPTRIPPAAERVRTGTQTATAQRAAAVRAQLARQRAGQVRPPAKGVDYRVPVYGGTAAVTTLGVGKGVYLAGEGIKDAGAGIAKTASALPFITVIVLAIVGLIGLKYFRRRQ